MALTNLPPELQLEADRIRRRQAMAEMLMKQSLEPIQQPQGGRYVAPVSPFQGIAKLAGAYFGQQGLERGDQEARGLAERVRGNRGALLQGLMSQTKDDPRGAIVGALESGDPVASNLATTIHKDQLERARHLAEADFRTKEARKTREEADARAAAETKRRDEERTAETKRRDAERAAEAATARGERAVDQENLARTVASLRQPPVPPAPSITEIVDPLNRNQMIRVDTRAFNESKYRAGDKTGVVGVAGKEPSYAKREEERSAGKRNLVDAVDQLAGTYERLEGMRAVVDPKQGTGKNVWERAAASGPGQFVAGFVGTKAQTERDKIGMMRPAVLTSIMQASGMSARALDSNVELQFYVQLATDPTKGHPANIAALSYLNKRFGLGLTIKADPRVEQEIAKQAPKQGAAGAIGAPAAPALPPGFKPDPDQ